MNKDTIADTLMRRIDYSNLDEQLRTTREAINEAYEMGCDSAADGKKFDSRAFIEDRLLPLFEQYMAKLDTVHEYQEPQLSPEEIVAEEKANLLFQKQRFLGKLLEGGFAALADRLISPGDKNEITGRVVTMIYAAKETVKYAFAVSFE